MYRRVKELAKRSSAILESFFFLRQQYRHLEAGTAYLSSMMDEGEPSKRFVLFGRGRSGTTALVSMLNSLPAVECEGEILRRRVLFPHLHVVGRSANSESEVYGCKVLSYQIRDVQWALSSPTNFVRTLHQEDGFQVLYLRRTNLLQHALSNIRARREGFHQKKSEDSGESRAIRVDPDNVVEWMHHSEALNDYEEILLEEVPHLSLTYEKNIRDPNTHQATIDEISEFLGVESVPVQSNYEKISPYDLDDKVQNSEELVRRINGTKYEKYVSRESGS